MTFVLLYGNDGTGKSVLAKQVLELSDSGEHWSLATKNRKLYEKSSINSSELLAFNADDTVNPYKTMDAFHDRVAATVKLQPDKVPKVIVVDEITLLRSWAQPVVIEEINRVRRSQNKFLITKIGEQNAAAWARVNQLVYGELEHIANWAVIHNVVIIAITQLTELRTNITDDEGQVKSVGTGTFVVDAKENIRKLADVRILTEKDGRNGRGFWITYEKTQDWMAEILDGNNKPVYALKVDKDGLYKDLMARGVIE